MTAVLPQHMQALETANRVRSERRDLKAVIAAGGRTAATVILVPPECALSMSVFDVLKAQHQWGTSRARKLLRVVGVSERRTLGELTQRQRDVLADLLTWGQ